MIETRIPVGFGSDAVFEAASAIKGMIYDSPVRPLPWLSRLVGVPVFAKLEHQQLTGSFKARGAANALRHHPLSRHVVAASAGNHGLAVAEVARRQGRNVTIFIPANASRLKRERILATGAGLMEHGTSLEEAIEAAKTFATTKNGVFVSPYNDPAVILGNASLALDMHQQIGPVTAVVVPVGGGGLISGMGLGYSALGAQCSMVGCEPSNYASLSASFAAGAATRVVHRPTLADGLAVNLEPGALTYELCRLLVTEIVCLSEEELAAGTLALLTHESLLVEPAGAAGVIAVLRLAQAGKLAGPVAIPLCGGNIHHTTLARVQRYPFTDPDLLHLLDLRGRMPTQLAVPRGSCVLSPQSPASSSSPRQVIVDQLASCQSGLDAALGALEEWRRYCEESDLVYAKWIWEELRAQGAQAKHLLAKCEISDEPDELARGEAAIRWGRSMVAHLRSSLNWCSASYDQAHITQFFDLGAQENPTVNYERFEDAVVRVIENQLLEVFALPADRMAISVTSSGMAAYTLVEALLLRRPRDSDRVLLAPYIYFEAKEQLQALRGVTVSSCKHFEADQIAADAARVRPFALFVDPLSNHAPQRMTDVDALLRGLRERAVETTVVIDGTMVSGALSAATLTSGGGVEILYYESGSKYLQLGFDASMAGFAAYPIELQPVVERLRRNTGTIMSRHGAELFPRYTRAEFLARMQRISRNAATLATLMAEDPAVAAQCQVVHPSSASHRDHAIASRLPFSGGCVTFQFHDEGFNNRDLLEALIDDVLVRARARGVHLTKGVSFGFAAPRISAAASMAENDPPFLRLYAGDRGEEQTRMLAQLVGEAIGNLRAEE